jgi:magnesium-transporting ATPase (P-type)
MRDGVPDIIKAIYAGGTNVRMISGDNLYTAIELAKKAGILDNVLDKTVDKQIMLGKDFRELVGGTRKTMDHNGEERWEVGNVQNFRAIAMKLKVLARATPEDKFTFVVGIK